MQHQYLQDKDFDFGTVSAVLKDTESGPQVDPSALRKLFKTPKKSPLQPEVDAISLMKLFVNPNFIKSTKKETQIDTIALKKLFKTPKKRQSIVYDAEFMSKMFDDRSETFIYRKPDAEGKIVDEKDAEDVVKKVLRKSIKPGDLCRLFALPKETSPANLSGVADLFNEPDDVDTLCAVLSPVVRKRWSQNKKFEFGTLDAVLKKEKNKPPEIDPYALRRLFHTPKTKSKEVIDPVSLIRLFLNPSILKKSRKSAQLDPIALSNMFRTPKKRKVVEPAEIDSLALLRLFAEEEPESVYKIVDRQKVENLFKKDKKLRKSLHPGDLCRLFAEEKERVDPNISGLPELFYNSEEAANDDSQEVSAKTRQNENEIHKPDEKIVTGTRKRTRIQTQQSSQSPIVTGRRTRGRKVASGNPEDKLPKSEVEVADIISDSAGEKIIETDDKLKVSKKPSTRQTRATKVTPDTDLADEAEPLENVIPPKTPGRRTRRNLTVNTESIDLVSPVKTQTRTTRHKKSTVAENNEIVPSQLFVRKTRRNAAEQNESVGSAITKKEAKTPRRTRRNKAEETVTDDVKSTEVNSSSSNTRSKRYKSKEANLIDASARETNRKHDVSNKNDSDFTTVEEINKNQHEDMETVPAKLPGRRTRRTKGTVVEKKVNIERNLRRNISNDDIEDEKTINDVARNDDESDPPTKTPLRRTRRNKVDKTDSSSQNVSETAAKTPLTRTRKKSETDAATEKKKPRPLKKRRNQQVEDTYAEATAVENEEILVPKTRSGRRRKVDSIATEENNNDVSASKRTRKSKVSDKLQGNQKENEAGSNKRTRRQKKNEYEELEKVLSKLETVDEVEENISVNIPSSLEDNAATTSKPKRSARIKVAVKAAKTPKKNTAKKQQVPKRLSTIIEESPTPLKRQTRSRRRKG